MLPVRTATIPRLSSSTCRAGVALGGNVAAEVEAAAKTVPAVVAETLSSRRRSSISMHALEEPNLTRPPGPLRPTNYLVTGGVNGSYSEQVLLKFGPP